jgi:hypothetical protein
MRILITILLSLFMTGPISAQDIRIRLDPEVPAQTQQTMQQIVGEVAGQYQRELNFDFPDGLTVVISGSADFLARDYTRQIGGNFSTKRRAFEDWIYAEATFDRIYVNTSHPQFHNASGAGANFHRKAVLLHELFHVLQYQLAGNVGRDCCPENATPRIGPIWLMESGANYAHQLLSGELRGYLSWAEQNAPAPSGQLLRDLEGRRGMDQARLGYDTGAIAVDVLVGQVGISRLVDFYASIGATQDWRTAFRDTFGMTVEQFYDNLS